MPVEVEVVQNPDVLLMDMERVITGDAVILDNCKSWFNLSGIIIEKDIKNARVVSFRGEKEEFKQQ